MLNSNLNFEAFSFFKAFNFLEQFSSNSKTTTSSSSSSTFSNTTTNELSKEILSSNFPSKPLLRNIFSASVGGALTAFLVTPLDVVKARLQSQSGLHLENKLILRGTWDAFLKISKHEGFFNLWRGLSPTLVMVIPSTALYLTTYEIFKDSYSHNLPISIAIPLAGISARVLNVMAISPLEMVRTYLQSTPASHSKRTFDVIQTITRGGLKNLFIGLNITLIRDAPFSAIYWSGYEYLSKHLLVSKLNPKFSSEKFLIDFLSGASAGMFAAFLTNPADVVKTRRQMQIGNTSTPSKAIQILKSIIKEEGFVGLFTGILPRMLRIAPACAILISSYEFGKTYLSPYFI